MRKPVLWIRISFSADPDQFFYRPKAKPLRIQADPDTDPGQTFKSQKVEFLHEKYAKSRQ
jgi:hypothetical protein